MTTTQLCLVTLCAGLVSIGAIAPAAGQICEGDCNSDDSVAIDEIIVGVRTLLGAGAIDACRAMDSDGNDAVTVNEVVAAVTRALQGCGPAPPTTDEVALAASVRVATDSIFRFFDFQASVERARGVAAQSTGAAGRSTGGSDCLQFDCLAFGEVTGTREDCCSGGQFSQFFSGCIFDDDQRRVVTLDGLFTLASDGADVCTGAIPVGASFTASLNNFTQDVRSADGSFSHTFQELTEVFEAAPGGCTAVSELPDTFGFGIRGDGLRFIDGELRQFQGDGRGNVLVDVATRMHTLQIAVGSTQEADGCTVSAALNGSVTSGDFAFGREFTADLTDFHVVQRSQPGALLLEMDGTVGIDCVGDATLSTIEPLRTTSKEDTCFTAGRLEAHRGDGTVSVTYNQGSGLDFDFGANGSTEQHFATCTDVPVDQCKTSVVGLCGPCTGVNDCERGLGCFPCSLDCSGNTGRCSLSDTFAICEDGVF